MEFGPKKKKKTVPKRHVMSIVVKFPRFCYDIDINTYITMISLAWLNISQYC